MLRRELHRKRVRNVMFAGKKQISLVRDARQSIVGRYSPTFKGSGLMRKECQQKDWTEESHKRECAAFKAVRGWNSFRWDQFDGVHLMA